MTTAAAPVAAGTFAVDIVHSNLGFRARHFGLTWLRGSFGDFEATLTIGEDGKAALVGNGEVAKIDVGNDQLLGHLQSPDFFDAQLHPTVRFESTDVNLADDGTATITGSLTMKGATNPVTLRGTWTSLEQDPYGNARLGLEVGAEIDRDLWQVSWNAEMPTGGSILGPKVRLEAELELVRQ